MGRRESLEGKRNRSRSRRLRRALGGVTGLAVVLTALTVALPAGAVHDFKFQLDGDVISSTTTSVGGVTQTVDWDTLFNANGGKKPLPAGFTASTFSRDLNVNANGSFDTSDDTTFTSGSKDTLPISTGWSCAASANVNSKVDIMNAYSTAFTAANGHQILYFALERNTNTGDGNVGFWFLQRAVDCDANGGTASFTGDHSDGDLLIVSAFTNGGSVSTVDVYRWNGGANGTLGTTPVAHGVDCKITAGQDAACATVNSTSNGTNGTITTPWTTANAKDGVGHSLRTSEFFEGGLDLTASDLGGKCFNVFTGDTRSSQSLTATIFDYALGTLGECTSTTVTTPTPTAGSSTVIPANGKLTTSDSALVTVTGIESFDATLTFHLCGPFAANATTRCGTGGALISTQSITADGTYSSTYESGLATTITSAGRYCWRADFSGDSTAGVPGSSDSRETECFVVNPRQPTLTTQAGAGPVDFGNPVTDTATLGNTANRPGTGGLGNGSINPLVPGAKAGGTISFTLYKNNTCTTVATGTGGPFPLTLPVDGNGTYGPVSFTPDAPGTYHWVASYSGNPPNTLASSPSACLDTNEDVEVQQVPTTLTTRQFVFPQDKAKIAASAGGDLDGSIVFRLFDTAAHCTGDNGTATATGLLYPPEAAQTISGTSPQFASTHNTTFRVTSNTTVFWHVKYTSNNPAQVGSDSCVESTQVAYAGNDGSIAIP
jgi:hypothetical protein